MFLAKSMGSNSCIFMIVVILFLFSLHVLAMCFIAKIMGPHS